MYNLYKEHYTKLKSLYQYRSLPNKEISLFQNDLIDFGSNDYLAFSKKKELLLAAKIAGEKYGIGSTGSRLLSGNNELFEELEAKIAIDKGTESALIFNTGFQANLAVLASLLDQKVLKAKPVVFFDKLNHSSLYQAVFLSGAELVRYRHNDMQSLSDFLAKFHNDPRPKFIVTETIFGMDGDILPIKEIVDLAKKYQAFLYLDEAHATGVIGKGGYGLSSTIDLKGISHLIMGTFSKALGCSGAYIACNEILKNYLINKATGFIYSTSNSPMVIGAVLKAWEMVRYLEPEREQLFGLAEYLRGKIKELGYNVGSSTSHIIPIIMGKEELTHKAKEKLLERNILVSSIRPPTVPLGTSRLRIALKINHNKDHINQLVNILKDL